MPKTLHPYVLSINTPSPFCLLSSPFIQQPTALLTGDRGPSYTPKTDSLDLVSLQSTWRASDL